MAAANVELEPRGSVIATLANRSEAALWRESVAAEAGAEQRTTLTARPSRRLGSRRRSA